jgi:hypothetical protein
MRVLSNYGIRIDKGKREKWRGDVIKYYRKIIK